MSHSLEKLGKNGSTVVELFSWVRRQLFMATTESIFGPKNPFRDSTLEQAWYNLSQQSRSTCSKYCKADVAATEIGQMVASLTNSVPAAFWVIYHVFSDPVVLGDYRKEVEQLIHTDDSGLCTVNLANIKSACPILLSTWQETLRYGHIGISARVVMKDIMSDNKYLLKKGATIMTIASVPHTEVSVWGPTVDIFDHRRFLRKHGEKSANPVAVRSFGGGAALCPGRHFVSTEVMAFTALLLLQFDLKPVATGGKWMEPRKFVPVTSAMPATKDTLEVKNVSRDNRNWQVNYSAPAKGVDMVAEEFAQGQ
ncbi:c14e0334-a53c-4457-8dd9-2fc4d010469c [Sclerotinia trifoliorum]|uniref:C14e0334-a53c-4457-8dd9-2fc4d010469c n=1 Tax=Sclerotinia trifoliorum TaxID=28548 RepID=A0A8H2W1R5_9HELO|nr:c14e0334-a53c-4457-8dd9-2fc4d010469c [Sclerotinia trifoliorum]